MVASTVFFYAEARRIGEMCILLVAALVTLVATVHYFICGGWVTTESPDRLSLY